MRITFVLPYAGMGGGVRAVAMYAKLLSERGHSVLVVSTPPPPIPLRRKVLRLLRGEQPLFPPKPMSHLDLCPSVARRVIPRYRPVVAEDLPDADVVIATWWETAEWVARLPATKGAKVYFVQHHEVVFDNQPIDRIEQTYRFPMQKICCAQWLTELMRVQYNDPTAICVPYGLDHALFSAPPRGKQKRPTIGMMYATSRFKGCDVGIEAVRIASRNIPNLTFRCFGQKPPTTALPLPPDALFELLPTQERIVEIYSSCDAWLMPSRCEGFGMPVLEAMGCRTPVIGTPTGVMPEALSEGGGILVPPDNVPSLAVAIERICRMLDGEWREMSEAAYRTAGRYQWESSVRLFENALHLAMQRGERQVSTAPSS
ncbi:MAG: glycosyltransferase family 4 protein [Phycisphaerae bacterium]|nr:glycosyltransferase family 4 protein [Phycisphaerae bacterium]MDW8260906.1 glycosyltransferase family 4 protein [Phycisphaerales bacterium]